MEQHFNSSEAGELSGLERRLYTEVPPSDKKKFVNKATDWYFMPKSFEKNGRLYGALGVRHFKKLCAETYRKLVKKLFGTERAHFVNNYLIWDFSEDGLRKFDYATRINEGIHLLAAALFTSQTVDYLSDGRYGMAALGSGLNLALGVYPILTQRYNRARIYNTVEKMQERNQDACLSK